MFFSKILMANRGVVAVRVLRTCRELGIPTVAVYSDADRASGHLQHASESCHLGPAAAHESYRNVDRLVAIAQRTGCDAVHPGYGFLSESPEFARRCERAGLRFIGPSPELLELLGDKIACRNAVAATGVAVLRGSDTAVVDAAHAHDLVQTTGLPVILKASHGGGGLGTRIVHDAAELGPALATAQHQALKLFGNDAVLLERYVARARHIEVQILGDHSGGLVHLFERECSLQRHHQKVIEEAPSTNLTPSQRTEVHELALRAARALRCVGACTVEFLFDGERFYFLEINPRLQVEHGVTEAVTGVDLVAAQIRIAAGERLGFVQADVGLRGYALEARVYAEDPATRLPAPGAIDVVKLPYGPGVRVDTFVEPGMRITDDYDPMIAIVAAIAESKPIAVARLATALRQLVVNGTLRTNVPLLLQILGDPRFLSGEYHTEFLTRRHFNFEEASEAKRRLAATVALVACARSDAPDSVGPGVGVAASERWRGRGWKAVP